jgi:predicted Rossmann fold flavoprotein
MKIKTDVLVIGAGAAGLMCAIEAAKRGRRVVVMEKTNRPGKKILMSGGGRCNFTNIYTHPDKYISHNVHFCKSALSRYTPSDFIALVESYQIRYYEKKLGQLFCHHKSSDIVDMLLAECEKYKVKIELKQDIKSVKKLDGTFEVISDGIYALTHSLVIATGGLSIPTLGSSPFGFQIAEQFDLKVYPTRAGLVPFTAQPTDKGKFETLAGISVDVVVSCRDVHFRENILFTHRGLSGPAILQISSYWQPGDEIELDFDPDGVIEQLLLKAKQHSPNSFVRTILSEVYAKKFISVLLESVNLDIALKSFSEKQQAQLLTLLKTWKIKPNGTEGYRTAEVTLGGVDCDALSSKTFEVHSVRGLYFIGEVLDVTGWLGGYNFQWAWASGWAAGQVV